MKKTVLIACAVIALNGFIPLSGMNLSVAFAAESVKDPFPLKNSKRYDESQDPAFRRCGTNSSGPQHGFYAVPLLILGISGAVLYFLKTGGEE